MDPESAQKFHQMSSMKAQGFRRCGAVALRGGKRLHNQLTSIGINGIVVG
jgi:hypothetical protein